MSMEETQNQNAGQMENGAKIEPVIRKDRQLKYTGNILKIRVKKLLHLGGVYAKMSKRSLKRQFGFIKRSNKKRGTEYGKRKKDE